ncbi:NEP1-interacting protein 1, partial [Triticum aestivum]|uniref:NEP1-interacting protein 1 n=1 Tax=Triticum aestivum TaxID=4565 RepID=UPI001D01BAEA
PPPCWLAAVSLPAQLQPSPPPPPPPPPCLSAFSLATAPSTPTRPTTTTAPSLPPSSVCVCSCAAGLFLGAVTGGLIGLATESGLFRGTGIGAITGALVSIEVVDSSIRLWRSRRSGIWSILYVLNVIYSLLTGRLVREKVDPAVHRVVWSQMNAVDSSQFREAPDLFDIEGTNGMPSACIDKLPEIRITEEYNQNAVGHVSRCSVCLQLNVIYSLLTGRLVHEKVDPAVQRVVWSQQKRICSMLFLKKLIVQLKPIYGLTGD